MKQLIQNLKTGETSLAELPSLHVKPGHVLIQTYKSLISAGTERMLVEFGKANLLQKARQQPDRVKDVLAKVKTDGLLTTLDAVNAKLDQPLPLGYCNVGRVMAVGAGVDDLQVGDLVASNGNHAEEVCVPRNLCAKIPEGVSLEEAAFTVLGSIALQGVRLAQPELGETFCVQGLGLLGLLTVQILRANGCKVIGVDFDEAKLALAKSFGAEVVNLSQGADPVLFAQQLSQGKGIDGVLITASTASNEPVHQAAEMTRKRGRIILVGVVGLELKRADFYQKELSFQVSCSYGPGRYEEAYEKKGYDYPIGYVRWTEQRNFEAVLELLRDKKILVQKMISDRFAFAEAKSAYERLLASSSLGIILDYPQTELPHKPYVQLAKPLTNPHVALAEVVVGAIGAGNYASRVLLPAFQKAGARLKMVASAGGLSAVDCGKKLGFEQALTDAELLLQDPEVNTVVIATRHNTHAHFVTKALQAGKNVFVEKPLCLTQAELQYIEKIYHEQNQQAGRSVSLMLGFNRRFSPLTQKMQQLMSSSQSPKNVLITVNAGFIPHDHWTQDAQEGGGRVLGEACHFIDLLQFLLASKVVDYSVQSLGKAGDQLGKDNVCVSFKYEDGSVGTIHYFANGHKSFPKERVEVFVDGKILQLDNFRLLRGFGWKNFSRMRLWKQNKGQTECVQSFVRSLQNSSGLSPISFEEIKEVSRLSILIAES